MKKIVFTGGPSAGKTSIIRALKENFMSQEKFYFAPEVASMLLGNGFPRCSTSERLSFQQRAIFHTQREMESLLEEEDKYEVCFFDRGLIDAMAYVENPSSIHSDIAKLHERYDYVFHLEVAPMNSYDLKNNNARTESHNEALKLESRLKELWGDHKNYIFVKSEKSFEEKLDQILLTHLKKII